MRSVMLHGSCSCSGMQFEAAVLATQVRKHESPPVQQGSTPSKRSYAAGDTQPVLDSDFAIHGTLTDTAACTKNDAPERGAPRKTDRDSDMTTDSDITFLVMEHANKHDPLHTCLQHVWALPCCTLVKACQSSSCVQQACLTDCRSVHRKLCTCDEHPALQKSADLK
jgi:hypothetical protein